MQMYNLDVKREDGRYAKVSDIYNQIHENFEDFPEEQICVKFNGEPSWNENVNLFLIKIAQYNVFPIVATRLPKNNEELPYFLSSTINLFNEDYKGHAFLNLCLGSTSEKTRQTMYGEVLSLTDISKLLLKYPVSKCEKFVLSFDPSKTVDAGKIAKLFSPEIFSIYFQSPDGLALDYPDLKNSLKAYGFTVLSTLSTDV